MLMTGAWWMMPGMSSCALRVQVVDPSAFTPPYDHALSGALAHAGRREAAPVSRVRGLLIRGAGDARGGDCGCDTRCGSHPGIVPAAREERNTLSACSPWR